MKASIIIPHWNGKQHLADCLDSLRAQTWRDFEVLLVDNGSADGSQAYIRTNYPEVRLIELGRNHGFTGACNAGFAHSVGEVIVLLNNDTSAEARWLAEIMTTFQTRPEVGIIASKLLLFDKRDHFHTAGDLCYRDGIPANRGAWERDEGQYDQPEYVFSACGAASAYRRPMLEQIGFLDDDFFFSCEDVDMGWRAQLSGWQVLYLPSAVVYHKLKATGGSVTGSYYDGRNYIYLLCKNYPTSLFWRYWREILSAQWQITREALQHWRGEAARARLRGQLMGILGMGKMLGKRRHIQVLRRVSDPYLLEQLSSRDR